MYETDILGSQIANRIKNGDEVSTECVRSWLNIYPDIKDKDSFRSTDISDLESAEIVKELSDFISSEIKSEKNVDIFNNLLENLDIQTKLRFLDLIVHYV